MKTRMLGALKVSALGFGTMELRIFLRDFARARPMADGA